MKKQILSISNIKSTVNPEIFQIEVRCTEATGSSKMSALQATALRLEPFGKTSVAWMNVSILDVANEDGSSRGDDSMNLEIGDNFSDKWLAEHGQEVAIQTTEISEDAYNALDEDEQLSFSQKGFKDEAGEFQALLADGKPFYKTTDVVLADEREDTLITHDVAEVSAKEAKGAKAPAVKA